MVLLLLLLHFTTITIVYRGQYSNTSRRNSFSLLRGWRTLNIQCLSRQHLAISQTLWWRRSKFRYKWWSDVFIRSKQFQRRKRFLNWLTSMNTFFIIYFSRQFSSSSQLFKITFNTSNIEMVRMLFFHRKGETFLIIS